MQHLYFRGEITETHFNWHQELRFWVRAFFFSQFCSEFTVLHVAGRKLVTNVVDLN